MPKLKCPHCATVIEFAASAAGTTGNCPACGGKYRAPAVRPPSSAALTAAPPARPPARQGKVVDVAAVSDAEADDIVEASPEAVGAKEEPVLLRVDKAERGERPPRRRDPDDDAGPRRRRRPKPRRRREPGQWFSLIDMIPMPYNLQINVGIGLWVLCGIVGSGTIYHLEHSSGGSATFALGEMIGLLVLVIVQEIVGVWGCAAYAKDKGYSELFGLIGLLGCLGFAILFFFPRLDER
jgi:hypothetical protein